MRESNDVTERLKDSLFWPLADNKIAELRELAQAHWVEASVFFNLV